MKKLMFRFVSVFVAAAMLFLLAFPVFASSEAEYVQKSNFWHWFAGVKIKLSNLSGWTDIVGYVTGQVCTRSGDYYHHASSYVYQTGSNSYDCFCDYCGEAFKAFESDFQQSYDSYVSTLDDTTVSYTTQYSTTYYYQIDTVEGPYTDFSYSLTNSSGTRFDWSFSSSPSFVLVSGPTITNSGSFNKSGSFSFAYHGYASGSVLFWVTTKPFTPISDFSSKWSTMGSKFSLLTLTQSDGSTSVPSYNDYYCTVLHSISPSGSESCSWKWSYSSSSYTFKSGYTYYFTYPVVFSISTSSSDTATSTLSHTSSNLSYYPLCYSYDGDVSQVAEPSTRMASVMETINNYNTTNNYIDNSETVNYYIGTVDDSNNVTNIYAPNIFNEETLIFTEPQTGTQYQCTGWRYSYQSGIRGYGLALEPGTYTYNGEDILAVALLYLDDALYIIGYTDEAYASGSTSGEWMANATFVDKYAYVRVAQSECVINGHTYTYENITDPTCTTPGERKYTCAVCGNEYVEEIPKIDHVYEYSIYQEAACLETGIGLYTCSACGDQYTELIPASGHSYEMIEYVSTEYDEEGRITKVGYTRYRCTVCGTEEVVNDDVGIDTESFWDRLKDAFTNALASIIELVLDFITFVLEEVLGLVKDLLSFFFDFLSATVIAGIGQFFSAFTDGSLFEIFTQENEDGTTTTALPEGIAAVFAFFSGVIMALPWELRSILIFGIAALVLIAVFNFAKS